MPAHPPQWTDFLQCSQCSKDFTFQSNGLPTTLLCGHSVCKACAGTVKGDGCRYDQNTSAPVSYLNLLSVNSALLKIVQYQNNAGDGWRRQDSRQLIEYLGDGYSLYLNCTHVIESLAVYLQDIKNGIVPQSCELTKPMLRKLVALVQCQIALEEGRSRALRLCRAIGERVSTELILAHQNPATLSGNLWTAVRARGCQFLGPAMQEEALKLILLALEDGSELSRKVLVMFVVQKLQQQFPQASKTSIGHVVQLLYRASCFVVKKRDGDSSLMKLKEDYRTYQALRREHDAQVVQIAREAGLRIAPDQWSALLYGDQGHKPHMQSIIDILQSGETLKRCIQDLENALEKSNNPCALKGLIPHFQVLAEISDGDEKDEKPLQKGDWSSLLRCLQSVKVIIQELVIFSKNHSSDCWRDEEASAQSAKFKTSFCRDMKSKGRCPRGASCMFAHTDEELHLYRNKRKKASLGIAGSRDLQQRPKPLSKEDDTGSSANDLSEQTIPLITTTAQGEVDNGNHPNYYHPEHYPTASQHYSVVSHSQHSAPINTISGQHPTVIPSLPYRHPVPANFYRPYDLYNQRPLYPTQPQHSPMLLGSPTTMPPIDQHGANLASRDQMTVKTGNSLDPNMSQFTVTLSFQSNPNQQQSPYCAMQSMPNAAHPHYPDISTQRASATDTTFARQAQVMSGHRDHHVDLPRQSGGFYPIQHAQPDHAAVNSNYAPPLPRSNALGPSVEPPRYQASSPAFTLPFAAGGDPRVAVLPPRPMVPSPTHLYDPTTNTLFPHGSPVTPNLASPVLMGPSHSPSGQPSSRAPVYIPVVPLPVAQYQVVDQVPSMRMHTQMVPPVMQHSPTSSLVRSSAACSTYEQDAQTGSFVSPRQSGLIPKSIECATLPQLEMRKERILNILIQKTKKQEFPVTSGSQRSYNSWMCESYKPPFLSIATTNSSISVMEHLQADESIGNAVDVVAELDTGTKQVTVRDVHHINTSHARNERTVDDEKMHRTLLETHNHLNSTTQGLRTAANYSRSQLSDEFVPFTDHQMVSKYGPIARSVRTRNSDSDVMQAIAYVDVDTRPIATMVESTTKSQSFEDPASVNAYSSFESLHAVSHFPAAASDARDPHLRPRTSETSPDIHSFSGSMQGGVPSLSQVLQAASNSQLLRREQAALQQSQAHPGMEDLELAMELQQIEISIQRKKLEQRP